MEQDLLQFIIVFGFGIAVGVIATLLVNKLRSGSVSPASVRQEYENYQAEVERHFEETSNKFKDMTEQYQDLYKHLSVGATSLCRPDSVAAGLADQRSPMERLTPLEDDDSRSKTPTSTKPESEKVAEPIENEEKPISRAKPNIDKGEHVTSAGVKGKTDAVAEKTIGDTDEKR